MHSRFQRLPQRPHSPDSFLDISRSALNVSRRDRLLKDSQLSYFTGINQNWQTRQPIQNSIRRHTDYTPSERIYPTTYIKPNERRINPYIQIPRQSDRREAKSPYLQSTHRNWRKSNDQSFRPQTSWISQRIQTRYDQRVLRQNCFPFEHRTEKTPPRNNINLNSTFDAGWANFSKKKVAKTLNREQAQCQPSKPLAFDRMPASPYKQKHKQVQNQILSNALRKRLSFGSLQKVKLLGSGKFGKVHLVVHKETGWHFAMKAISKQLIREYQMVQQVISQIKILSVLEHPNIVKLYEVLNDDSCLYLVQQLGDQANLYKILRVEGRFSEERVVSIVKQVLSALLYMHQQRIIHRDIKPENIILQGTTVKLIDFGWSARIQHFSRTTFCGTPQYVCPEIVKGEQYDESMDSWALGVLAFELLFGKSPFAVQNQNQMDKIVRLELEFPQEIKVSDSGKDFIRRMLRKDKAGRMTMQEGARHHWLTVL